ncbi:hypothetical protein AK812_SmicGene28859 [Symbiodinium microadriaticum]|uniref:Uncharacterized protein n=1 Tax=Symbiodinium microadriaticum TaxID=2951 RepID=A0A1Q9D3A4_SYMMI|nr:hypothetical protein AK812_SmicGene28859 [Symbiodinium microadriaticum]
MATAEDGDQPALAKVCTAGTELGGRSNLDDVDEAETEIYARSLQRRGSSSTFGSSGSWDDSPTATAHGDAFDTGLCAFGHTADSSLGGDKDAEIDVYSLSGAHIGHVTMDSGDSLGALKERIREMTGKSVELALGLSILKDNDDMTIASSGILETLHVQAINVSLHRFVYSDDGRCAGIYLMDDGTAEMFTLSRRMLNAREDEEQTQTMHWGTWSPGPSESVCIEVDQMERKVYSDAMACGWTQQSGRIHADFKMRFRWAGQSLQRLDQISEPVAAFVFPSVLYNLGGSDAHVFDDWHREGESTEP